ncbi:DUF4192 domain-containing protein [Aeromicrobium sp. Marseille-Q0843]|uniref:DUF4192 domain-containing protein n=1 Tax=Aeromicrobium phoceense TaxID=2754045 RepID=A0A838XFK8_9ACTN|nr:DUF4192 domain-containing protein [Aeromicrobium phoceense]MBA4608782.1 DUF4192 domain-containing protein [Aeromicrobium phoceense]
MPDDVFRAHTHEDLLNALPTFFGFVPRECVIGLAVSGANCRFGFSLRHDLPEAGSEDELAADLAGHLLRNGDEGFFLFALSDDVERARTMALALRDALPPRRDWLTIWADGERYWADLPGHPQDGLRYTLDDHHEAIVHAVAQGQVIARDRSDLAADVAPARGQRQRWLEAAHEEVLQRFMARALTTDPDTFLLREQETVARLTERFLAEERLTDGDLVELAVRVSGRQVRDSAWLRITRQNAMPMYALWAAVSRVAAADFAPASLCLAGFAAWQMGDGVRARFALERALALEPHYRMGVLLHGALEAGLHPDRWSAADASA